MLVLGQRGKTGARGGYSRSGAFCTAARRPFNVRGHSATIANGNTSNRQREPIAPRMDSSVLALVSMVDWEVQ